MQRVSMEKDKRWAPSVDKRPRRPVAHRNSLLGRMTRQQAGLRTRQTARAIAKAVSFSFPEIKISSGH